LLKKKTLRRGNPEEALKRGSPKGAKKLPGRLTFRAVNGRKPAETASINRDCTSGPQVRGRGRGTKKGGKPLSYNFDDTASHLGKAVLKIQRQLFNGKGISTRKVRGQGPTYFLFKNTTDTNYTLKQSDFRQPVT